MTDERNFRSSYYEKVGCYSVEEKKSLNKLLQDSLRNHAKLKQFCLSYTVNRQQRSVLWQLILGILPLSTESTVFVLEQRRAVYDDLLEAVRCLQYIDPSNKSNTFLSMWLLENNRFLHPNTGGNENDYFLEVVQVLLKIFDDDVETYWIAKEFFGSCIKEIQQDCPKLKDLTQTLLKREDIALYNHLEKLELFNSTDCNKWFSTCFAGLISESVLVKIWDKVCGGSRKIVIFVFLELVKTLRTSIIQCNSLAELKQLIEKVKDQDAAIVNKDQDNAIVNNAIYTFLKDQNASKINIS